MSTFVNGVVRYVGSHYADGAPRLEIWIPINQASGLPFRFNEPVPVELKIEQTKYRALLRSTTDNPYVWVSPTLYSSAGVRLTLGRVLTELAFRPNDRVRLVINGNAISVHREDAKNKLRESDQSGSSPHLAVTPHADSAKLLRTHLLEFEPSGFVPAKTQGRQVTIDIKAIKRKLFDTPIVRVRLQRDYMLSTAPADSDMLVDSLLTSLSQTPVKTPLDYSYTNANVFRAVVKALGSNSRAWASFLKHEDSLAEMLGGYDPSYTFNAVQRGELRSEDLAKCLRGQTSGKDANAILQWANLLAQDVDYYDFIRQLGHAYQCLANNYRESLTDNELMLCIVGYIGNPPKNWEGENFLKVKKHFNRKTPGMSYVLASEFMRNLGWDGFKPDRHVMRLFDRWLPEQLSSQLLRDRSQRLTMLIGRKDIKLSAYLKYSLIGADITPDNTPFSHADNLVWLLGAYVEKKGRESNHSYLAIHGQ